MRVVRALLVLLFVARAVPAFAADVPIVKPAATGAAWTPAEIAALDRDLDALLARAPATRGAHVAVDVVTPAGDVLYQRRATDAMQPASTFKLLVGSVALDRLGPAYRFRTTLTRAPGAPGAPDLLVLHGGGDPKLVAADLAAAADAAVRAGIAGPVDLRIDTSRVSSEVRKGDGWQLDDILYPYAPVVDGLPFTENLLTGSLVPAALGAPATIRLAPPFAPVAAPADACPGGPTLLTFANRTRTVAAGAPATVEALPGRCGEIVLRGDVPQGAPVPLRLAVDAPEELARAALAADLVARGITVVALPPATLLEPLPGIVSVPATLAAEATTIWTHDGVPLADLLGPGFWQPSDNLTGEQLRYELDAALGHRPATAAGATAVETSWLQSIGVDPAALDIADGSGLSQYDRITPRILTTILRHDWNGPYRAVMLDALPVLGVRGTTEDLGRGTRAAGRVFAKTGNMMHVHGLAGYAANDRHGAVVFALQLDDARATDDDLDALQSAFCARLVAD